MTWDVLVVGAGAAGMAAALSAREAGAASVLLADRSTRLGGVLHSAFTPASAWVSSAGN